ncbi:MAG: twin-arginine translocase TatA/TatE family subunit [Halobacteriales archaeon]
MSVALTPLQIPTPGGLELAVILLIAVLLFGAQKIPELARSTGQAMGEFRRGRQELEEELEELEETANLDEPVSTGSAQTDSRTQGSSSTGGGSAGASSEDEA